MTSNKKFTNLTADDILNIAEKSQNWLILDTEHENKTQAMNTYKVRYIDVLIKKLDGKTIPFYRQRGNELLRGKAHTLKQEDDSKIPSCATYSTRSRITDIKTEAEFKIKQRFPDLIGPDYEKEVAKYTKLLNSSAKEGLADEKINAEFIKLLSNSETQKQLKHAIKKDNIKGTLQDTRKYNPDMDGSEIPESGEVKLAEPLIYHRISINKKTGQLYGYIFDASKQKMTRATIENLPLTWRNCGEFLTAGSITATIEKYKLCICAKGAFLHGQVNEMHVLSNKIVNETQSRMDDTLLDAMKEYNDVKNEVSYSDITKKSPENEIKDGVKKAISQIKRNK
jgi:hypothetical protein